MVNDISRGDNNMIRGIRGATTVTKNDSAEIISATEKLLTEMIDKNHIEAHAVANVFISVTDELSADFPAKALRALDGWTYVPVMCMREIPVPHALERCIRIMVNLNTNKDQNEIQHVYLNDAVQLRPDLTNR